MEPGIEAHDFELTPAAGAALEQADLVLISGAGLEEWLDQVRELDAAEPAALAEAAEADAPARGACLVKDPRTGQSFCIRTTRDACKALKGSFLGGPCGD